MNQVRFLFDEQIPDAVCDALDRIEPAIVFLRVEDGIDTPPTGTSDPDLLLFAEREHLAIVSFDKRTMTLHADNHMRQGNQTWGVFIFPNGNHLSAGTIAEALVLIWAASSAEEWINRVEFLPY